MKARLSLLSAALLLGLAATGAQAAFQSCVGTDYNISTKVSTAYDCTILLPLNGNDNDTPQPGFVNDKAFFGITDWAFDGKLLDTPDSSFFDLTSGSDSLSGGFTYTGPTTGIEKIMMVFKDGSSTNLVGYLVTANDGSYSTPFTEPPFSFTGGTTSKDISHISVYYQSSSSTGGSTTTSGGGTTSGGSVPEPGVLGLIGLGLLGLGALRRRAV